MLVFGIWEAVMQYWFLLTQRFAKFIGYKHYKSEIKNLTQENELTIWLVYNISTQDEHEIKRGKSSHT